MSENDTTTLNPNIVIIGGGISGIAAARTLLNSVSPKFNVTLLEASDRIGGRIWTQEFGKYRVEFGAEWLHGIEKNPIYDCLDKNSCLELLDLEDDGSEEDVSQSQSSKFLCLTVTKTYFSLFIKNFQKFWSTDCYDFATENGEIIPKSLNRSITKFLNHMEADTKNYARLDKLCPKSVIGNKYYEELGLFHENKVISQAGLDWARRYLNAYDCADDWSQVSYFGTTVEYIELPGITNIPWKPPAYFSTFLSLLVAEEPSPFQTVEIPSWINLNHQVDKISLLSHEVDSSPGVSVLCKNGKTLEADHVICTIPLGVLKENHEQLFHPNLPLEKKRAIQYLGYGTVNKLYFEFESQWWPENFKGVNLLWLDCESDDFRFADLTKDDAEFREEFNGVPAWCRSLLCFQIVDQHPKALRSWITGPAARFLETQDAEYVCSTCMNVLRMFLSGMQYNFPDPIQFTMTKWFTNPYSRGTYSVRLIESEIQDVWAKDLAEPILGYDTKPVLCFGGEATSQNFYSAAHGAYESGNREAERILKYYKLSNK